MKFLKLLFACGCLQNFQDMKENVDKLDLSILFGLRFTKNEPVSCHAYTGQLLC